MQRFAELLDALSFQPARNGKLRLIEEYLASVPDPDRGYAMAALTGSLNLPNAKPGALRKLGTERLDETLFALRKLAYKSAIRASSDPGSPPAKVVMMSRTAASALSRKSMNAPVRGLSAGISVVLSQDPFTCRKRSS